MSYDLKKAGYDAEVNTAKAEADLAYDLKVGSSVELNLSWFTCEQFIGNLIF